MKRSIIAFAFAIFSTCVPLMMAQAVVEDAPITESSAKIDVDIEMLSPEQEGRLHETIDDLGDILGDRVKTQLKAELGKLDEDEKRQLSEAIGKAFKAKHIRFDTSGMGVAEAFVAITAICLTLGLPVIIFVLVLLFGQRKRRQMMELAGMYVKADQPIPDGVISEFGTGMNTEKRLRSGLQLIFVGIALVIVLGAYTGEGATLGLLPIAIGLARVIYWRYETKQNKEFDDTELVTPPDPSLE